VKVLLVATGGTVATRRDPSTYELLGRWSGQQLIDCIPGISDLCEMEICDYDNVASMEITPLRGMEIYGIIRERLSLDEYAGAVVTHGTDTLEETAYLLDLLNDTGKPVVVTGAMRGGGSLGEDGIRNLEESIQVVLSPASRGKGTMVVMNDEIHAACAATKTHSLNPDTFQSPSTGPLGEIWQKRIIYHFDSPARRVIPATCLKTNVDIIKVGVGMDDKYVRASIAAKSDAIVLETAGTGAMPKAVSEALQEAVSQDIPVAITTRCPFGGPAGFFGAAKAGFYNIPLPGQKARILMMVALGMADRDRDLLKRLLLAE
jgi:L-asparaginase